jgi:hypothetical protein
MAEGTRPDLLGYFAVKNRYATAATEAAHRQQLVEFAALEDYELLGIFTETQDTGQARIEALIDKARRDKVRTVAVLDRDDLTARHLQELAAAGIRVVTVPASP